MNLDRLLDPANRLFALARLARRLPNIPLALVMAVVFVIGQMLDRTVTIRSSGVSGTVYDVAMEQGRTRDWAHKQFDQPLNRYPLDVNAGVEALLVTEPLDVAMRALRVRVIKQLLTQAFCIGRLDNIVVKIQEAELSIDLIDKQVRIL